MEEQMTVISTENISFEAASWLFDRAKNTESDVDSLLVVFNVGSESGFLIPLNEKMMQERDRFPESFETAVIYATAKGSDWLMIDPIAKSIPLLRSYEW